MLGRGSRLNEGNRPRSSVAVVLPTYNREAFLPVALSSIVRQTVKPSQVVIVNDASSDRTPEIVEDFSKEAPFEVTVCNNSTNSGIGFSRQAGADRVRTEIDYVSYLSDDDEWHPQFLERMLTRATPGTITYCYYEVADQLRGKTLPPFQFPRAETKDEFLKAVIKWSMRPDMFVNFSSLLIPRKLLSMVPFRVDVRKGEDLLFLLDSLSQRLEYRSLEEILVRVVFHPSMGSLNWKLEERRKLVNYAVEALLRLGVQEETVRYGMRDAFYWARIGSLWPALRIRYLIFSSMRRFPPTKEIANSTLSREKLARERRIMGRIEQEMSWKDH